MSDEPRTRKPTNVRDREQRWRLCERQEWKCYWCHQPMVWFVGDGKNKVPDLAATTDHLDDRFSNERGKHPAEYRHVAAHKVCNERRARELELRVGIEVLRARAANHRKGRRNHGSSN